MSNYQCMECDESSSKPFKGGMCSKCGSLNIRNLDRKHVRKNQKETTDPKQTFLMILLGVFIIYAVATYT